MTKKEKRKVVITIYGVVGILLFIAGFIGLAGLETTVKLNDSISLKMILIILAMFAAGSYMIIDLCKSIKKYK